MFSRHINRHLTNRRCRVLIPAIAPVLAAASCALAGGVFDGEGQTTATRDWINPINWSGNIPPAPPEAIFFATDGDGTVDMNGVGHAHPSLSFGSWVSYTLFDGSFTLSPGAPTITMGASVSSTYGSEYFSDGTTISGTLGLGGAAQANTIFFGNLDTGTLNLAGPLVGTGSLALTRVAAGSNVRGVYFGMPNGGYSGAVTIGTGTAARLVEGGRTGTGTIALQGGELNILSDTGPQAVTNTISSASGTIRADHNYMLAPMPPFAPGTLHVLGAPGIPLTVDNPTLIGGTSAASVSFTANNGYNLGLYAMTLGNAGFVPGALSRTVAVDNGSRTAGYVGSDRLTGPNRLNEMVVTTTVGPPGGAAATFFDINPVGGAGIPLLKTGTGVLAIEGVNGGSSTGAKSIVAGVLRFNTPASIGAAAVGMPGGAVPLSGGFGVGYSVAVAGTPLTTSGTIAGQSGAFDVDTPAYVAGFVPGIVSTTAPFPMTALRLGSSGAGMTTGPIGAFVAAGVGTYYFGGGGGTLTIAVGAGPAAVLPAAAPVTIVQMGTTGFLLPGRVNLTRPVMTGAAAANAVNIRAGTLQVMAPGLIGTGAPMAGLTGGTSLGCYSTTLLADGSYAGAPAGTPYNGPGQLLLDATVQAGGGYIYTPGGPPNHFGTTGLTLAGGAIGYTPGGAVPAVVPIAAPPVPAGFPGVPPAGSLGTWGATLGSSLYTSALFAGAPMATNIMHFGGEYSTGGVGFGAITPLFAITNNPGPDLVLGTGDDVPVALIKSGLDSTLDLTAVGGHPHSGGTDIMGGEVLVNMPGQLGGPGGMGPPVVVITDGGMLHVGGGGPLLIPFPQVLRVANGPLARASRITVDPGITAAFSTFTLEASAAGSVLEKLGPGGALQFLPGFLYPSTAANTWGIKATEGLVLMNQLPGTTTPSNGSVIFDGGILTQVGSADAGFIDIKTIAPATYYHPNYGYSGIQSYAGTASTLNINDKAFFRITGAQTSSLMGALTINLGTSSVLKISGNALADDTRGTGTVTFNAGPIAASGAVQFTPGGGNILWPRDGGFTTSLNYGVRFSGCPDADINGNLLFNSIAGSPICFIDAATVDNTPMAVASTWTISGTGMTSWAGVVVKERTEADPGSGGPYVSGTVNINRNLGAPVSIAAGAVLEIDTGTLNAGGTGDPFTDTATAAHLPIINNASFNISTGSKHVLSIVGGGTTTVAAGEVLDVGSSGPVTQANFTVNGSADVGVVTVTGTASVGEFPASLNAISVQGGAFSISGGTATIKPNGNTAGTSRVTSLAIPSGKLDLKDNHLIVVGGTLGTWGGVSYSDMTGLVASGRGSTGVTAPWSGSGIVTSLTSAIGPNILTSIGIATAANARNITGAQTASFAGVTVTPSDVLVMYTYGGDANLSGLINADDYFQIDAHYGKTAAADLGWFNGDFTYNGTINGDDYFIIDTNFAAQTTAFVSSAIPGGVTAVPEPSAATLALAGVLFLRRKRRVLR